MDQSKQISNQSKPNWNELNDKKTPWIYRLVRWFVWLFSPKYQISGLNRIPDGPCVIVGNHSQMYGPIAAELYTPGKHDTWCAGQMMHKEEAAAYAFSDFWSGKPKSVRWFYRILSHLIVPLSVLIFNNAHTIPVYHDTRVITTYRDSIARLQQGSRMVIFPECYREHNQIVHAFQDKFVDLARFYYRKTGESLSFIPLYLAPKLKTMFFGKPIQFDPNAPIEQERERICGALMDAITEIAVAQPRHTVIPYPNIPKNQYPNNKPAEADK